MKTYKQRQIEEIGQEQEDIGLLGIDMSNPLNAIRTLIAEPGYTYEWQRYKLKDKQDPAYAFAISRGWKPIDKSKLPARFNLEVFEIYNPDPIAQKYICYSDLILMKRENALHEKEVNERANEAKRSVELADSYGFNVENPTRNTLKDNK